ncbi:retrovirus-related pol polyprotein from transposon TNT 1-94 [Tanacetum coccineum]|uniref:Retrovirus-related pol polyprotein from transposon TNT 1-94 n=1 Tax=Tanacetum coccineum TaxID=301880 RepID=A0ABQ5BVR5_9ASTR
MAVRLNPHTLRVSGFFKKRLTWIGIVHTYKARLVAKGYTQLYGVDYEETFSPVADIRAIRILISIAAYYDYEIWQMDIKYASFKIIYGLKQTSRSWNKRFDEEIKRIWGKQHLFSESKSTEIGSDLIFEQTTQGDSTPKKVKHMQNVPYAFVVGSIMYAVRCTRPDAAFVQNITSRFQQNHGESHWTAVKNILKYLRNIKDMFLVYGGNPEAELRVDCYCNAGFETDIDDMKSLTGYLILGSASEAVMEAVWIRKFISGLGIVPTINEPIGIFCDNSAALHFANEPGVQKGIRHYHRRYHYVRECIALGEIRFLKVHTDDNLADPFTKDLPKGKLTQHARSMGLRLASSFM